MKLAKNKGLKLSVIAAAISLATLPASIAAQESSSDEEQVERIKVTGSRISRDANIGAAAPIQTISGDDIRQSGEFSIAEVINDLPALFSSTTSEGANDSAFANGTNVLNLRGLGSNRTLVLVNGKRHVGGVSGASSVDVGSIPTKLLREVEVLTGGASAIYGADAVTGVVNFILKDDFEGFDFDAQVGAADEGDAQQYKIGALYGVNFDNDKGNFVVNVEYSKDEGLKAKDRDNGVLVGTGRDWTNPAKRFQQGDIDAASMPNFARFYDPSNSLPTYGLAVPDSADDFQSSFADAFGSSASLTQAEIDFITNAALAPSRAVLPGRSFTLTSGYGQINPSNGFTSAGAGLDPGTNIDLDGNGVPDCFDSFAGFNSQTGRFAPIGGCWTVGADGSIRTINDGLVAGVGGQGFGGDSLDTIQQLESYLIPPEDKLVVNLLGSYEVNDDFSVYGELKYVSQEVESASQPTSFWDLLLGQADNPYIPEIFRPLAQQNGGISITIDPVGIGRGNTLSERETIRAVAGFNGFLDNGWEYEGSLVYGEFERTTTQYNAVINDRFMAAIDAVTDSATGNPACRVDVDPSAPAQGTPFGIPTYEPGYFSFTPGAGQCVPLNIWAGTTGITQEAVDWVTRTSTDSIKIDQTVLSASLTGDLNEYFTLPAGGIYFALGAEYREEKSTSKFDPFQLGIIPSGSVLPEGSNIADVSGNSNLVFRPALSNRNEVGKYDVSEVFAELSIPLLDGAFLAEEMTLGIAARISDYSTIGSSSTWKADLTWSPYTDLRFRSSISQAVRAPNITELFGPLVGTTFRPADPCDINNDPDASTIANCKTFFDQSGFAGYEDGSGNYTFADPLTAAFGGLEGGNKDLTEETANTLTLGFVFTPEQLEGFTITLDYWDIDIENAINAVSGQNIVDTCFKLGALNPTFCDLIERSSTNGGFSSLTSSSINFASRETSGYDFDTNYTFDYADHNFAFGISGTYLVELNDYTDPQDATAIDPELGEINRPRLAGNLTFDWAWKDLSVGVQTRYQSKQLLRFVEIQDLADYGNVIQQDKSYVTNLTFNYAASENVDVYGGVNNITNEKPFITNYAYPASIRGRFVFFGMNYKM
jgi:iron complex outermembrane receptor protein